MRPDIAWKVPIHASRAREPGGDEVRDPVDEDAGLAAAGAREHEQRALGRDRGLVLPRVQAAGEAERIAERAAAVVVLAAAAHTAAAHGAGKLAARGGMVTARVGPQPPRSKRQPTSAPIATA
jgi:hypothetical protein